MQPLTKGVGQGLEVFGVCTTKRKVRPALAVCLKLVLSIGLCQVAICATSYSIARKHCRFLPKADKLMHWLWRANMCVYLSILLRDLEHMCFESFLKVNSIDVSRLTKRQQQRKVLLRLESNEKKKTTTNSKSSNWMYYTTVCACVCTASI